MHAILIALLLKSMYPAVPPLPAVFQAAAQRQTQAPDRHSNDGPLANTGIRCYRGETREGMAHCACEVMCNGSATREQPWDAEHQTGCVNYCAPQRHPPACVCHADENACDAPTVEQPPR